MEMNWRFCIDNTVQKAFKFFAGSMAKGDSFGCGLLTGPGHGSGSGFGCGHGYGEIEGDGISGLNFHRGFGDGYGDGEGGGDSYLEWI